MAKGLNQKLKLMYLADIMLRETDEAHGITLPEIITALAAKGIEAERKTLYQDLELLDHYGIEIEKRQCGRNVYYHVITREFEIAELKLLVDSVQASRFITEEKSAELIRKLESLASKYEAGQLHRQVVISGRVKSMNESILIIIDQLHTAIADNSQVAFSYLKWNTRKQLVPRHADQLTVMSPWALVWDDEKYYLLAYDAVDQKLKHYRVDKIRRLNILPQPRLGRSAYLQKDLARYTSTTFCMYGGSPVRVVMEAPTELVGVFIDRFGTELPIITVGEDRFQTAVDIEYSDQFFGWVVGLGDGVRILSPESVITQIKQRIARLQALYQPDSLPDQADSCVNGQHTDPSKPQ